MDTRRERGRVLTIMMKRTGIMNENNIPPSIDIQQLEEKIGQRVEYKSENSFFLIYEGNRLDEYEIGEVKADGENNYFSPSLSLSLSSCRFGNERKRGMNEEQNWICTRIKEEEEYKR